MNYHLNLLFDPTEDICKKGRFLPDNEGRDPNLRSRCWIQRTTGDWTFKAKSDSVVSIKKNSNVGVAIGIPLSDEYTVNFIKMWVLVAHDENTGSPTRDNANSTPFFYMTDGGETIEHNIFWNVEENIEAGDNYLWKVRELGTAELDPTKGESNGAQYRIQVAAHIGWTINGRLFEMQVGHDPVMQVDDVT